MRALRLTSIPIRLRLTLLFTVLMAMLLGGLGTFAYFHLKAGLDSGIDRALRDRATVVGELVRQLGVDRLAMARPPLERGKDVAQVIDYRGRVIAGDAPDVLLSPAELRSAQTGPLYRRRGEHARVLAEPLASRRVVIVVSASLAQRERAMESLAATLLIMGPLLLLLAAGGGYVLTGAALGPVERMRRRAATISADRSHARLPLPDSHDEIQRLGETLNDMLARLDAALERERSFVADASHELRGPLAILRMELELALRQGRSVEELQAALGSAIEESDRLARLAEDLLELARSDRDELSLSPRPVDAGELLGAAAARFSAAAAARGRHVRADVEPGLLALADEEWIGRALGNLIDNALSHGAGEIRLSARATGERVELHVTDDGPGFPPEFRERAFERFTRSDPARPRGGAGLGLALVAAIARAHGGEAGIGDGADVWIALPAARGERPSPPAPVEGAARQA